MKIIPADEARRDAWLALRRALWPTCTAAESAQEIAGILRSHREGAFLALHESGTLVGFAELSTREYVDGCHSSPVGYLEGIYVAPGYRNRGVGRALVAVGEAWAKSKGCAEMGSDTLLDNTESQAFHRSVGFREAERHVVFVKSINHG